MAIFGRDNSTNVRITATDETRGAIASATAGLGGLANSAENSISSLSRMGGLLAGGAVLGGLAALGTSVRNSINAFDDMGKMAQKLGVSVENLSRLTYAAKLSDIGTEQLSTGLRQLTKTMSEAPEKLAALGIAATDASGKLRPADQVLADIASRFAGAEDGAAKTAAAMELFGRSGADMIPLLNSGAAGLQAMAEQADALGVTIREQSAKDAETFNDNLTRLTETTKGLGYTIANNLLPTLATLSEKLLQFITKPTAMTTDDWMSRFFEDRAEDIWGFSNSIDRARVKFFEFFGAGKMADLARADLAEGEAAMAKLVAQRDARNFAPRGASGAALEPRAAGTLPSLASASKAAGGRAAAAKKESGPADPLYGANLMTTRLELEEASDLAAFEAEKLRLAEHQAELEQQHRDSRARILADYANSQDLSMRIAAARIDWETKTEAEKTTFMLAEAQNLTAGLAQFSKAAFNVNKAGAIGQTIMTTYEAAQSAFAAMAKIPVVGPALGALAAANAIAMGFARVKAIKSTQFGGGTGAAGVGGVPSLSGGIGAAQQAAAGPLNTADPPLLRSQAAAPRATYNVQLVGDTFDARFIVDKIIPLFNEAAANGADIRVSAA